MKSSMKRRRAAVLRTLGALTAGLVMLVLAVAPLHTHPAGADAPGACLLCEISHRPLDLPSEGLALVFDSRPPNRSTRVAVPRAQPRTDLRSGEPSIPRAPPLHS